MKGICAIFILICPIVLGQSGIGFVIDDAPSDQDTQKRTLQTHTSVLPLIRQTTLGSHQIHKDSSFLAVSAIGEAGFRYGGASQYRFGAGVLLESGIKDKWAFRVGAIEGIGLSNSIYAPKSYF